MNHILKKENLVVAANMAGYSEMEITGPQRGDISFFWRVYESLYQPEKKDFYRRYLPEMLELWIDAPQEYYRRGLERLQEGDV